MKIIQSHPLVFVSIICYLATFFVLKVSYELNTKKPLELQIYTGERLK